jgi:glucose/arabinose dehydrogenase
MAMPICRVLFVFITHMLFLNLVCLYYGQAYAQTRPTYSVSDKETCHGFKEVTSLRTGPRCVGLVADQQTIPWKMPRKLLFDSNFLYVTALGGWQPNEGQLWRLKLSGKAVVPELLMNGLDRPHGIQKGPDGFIYIGEATRIIRFDPAQSQFAQTVVENLPDSYRDARGIVTPSNHPLTEFIFLAQGHMVVNIGAPSNDCSEEYQLSRTCQQRDQQAEVRIYFYNPHTKSFDQNYKVLARGLRNSMGLLYNEGLSEIYQAENSADALGTPDEVNLIDLRLFEQGKTYDFGWPFCIGYKGYLPAYKSFRRFCETRADAAYLLLPPHAAPLDVKYYTGALFPDLQGSILMSWHGHRPAGSKVAIFKTDSQGRILPLPPQQLIEGWAAQPGQHPKGRPVGLAIDSSGAIFISDDVNGAILVVSKAERPLSSTDEKGPSVNSILTAEQVSGLRHISPTLRQMNCQSCHGDVLVADDESSLKNMISSGWVTVGARPTEQLLWRRMMGQGVRMMPPPPAENLNTRRFERARIDIFNWLQSF